MRKRILLGISICVLILISCQKNDLQKSPLEMMVYDYVEKEFPNWLNSTKSEDDTLYLHVHFSHFLADSISKIITTDSIEELDVIAAVGGNENLMVYPEYTLPLPPPVEDCDTINDKYVEQMVHVVKSVEQNIHEKESISPAFTNNKEKEMYYEGRLANLTNEIDSLCLLDPALIGYTCFGPIHVIILAEHDVDRNLVEPFINGVNVMDLRTRYIWHKKNEREIQYHGWGSFNVYRIEPLAHYKQVGKFLID